MKAIATLVYASLALATALERKQQTVSGYEATFPEHFTNVTGASSFTGDWDFTDVPGGVQVTIDASNFPSAPLRKRQGATALNYQIFSGPASSGCTRVGSVISGGDMSGQFGPLTSDPTVGFTFIDDFITTGTGANSISSGQSVVVSFTDGTIIACANIVASLVPPPSTVITVNIDVNVDITIVVCPVCPPLTTVVWQATYVPYSTSFYTFGNWYYCNTAGWYNILCPYTVNPGHTTTIQSCPYMTYTHCAYTTQTYTYNSPATTTIYTYPTSIYVPTSQTYTPPPTTTRPSTTVQPTYQPTVVPQVNSGSQAKYAGALAVVAGALALT